jgi:hypothetical protein
MTMTSRSILSAVLLLSVPATGAFAQNDNPVGMSSGDRVQTAATGSTNDLKELGPYTWKPGMGPAYTDPFVPGATGRTIVPGSHDTLAGDWDATLGTRIGGGVCC